MTCLSRQQKEIVKRRICELGNDQLAKVYRRWLKAGNGDINWRVGFRENPNKKIEVLNISILMCTVILGDIEIANLLIDAGANLEERTEKGNTLLMLWATDIERLWEVRKLIQKGVNVNAQNNLGETALIRACKLSNNEEMVRILLVDGKADPNIKDKKGNVALIYAYSSNKTAGAAKYLIDAGADVNAKNNSNITALHVACASNVAISTLEILLINKADVNARGIYGETPLMGAVYHKDRLNLSKLLVKYNANVNLRVDVSSSCGVITSGTALIYAAENDDLELVMYLISVGADVNAKGRANYTAFIYAIKNRNIEMAKFLAESGADTEAKTVIGISAIDFISSNQENEELVDIIRQVRFKANNT